MLVAVGVERPEALDQRGGGPASRQGCQYAAGHGTKAGATAW